MKQLIIVFTMLFAVVLAPLSTEASTKKPSNYEKYTFTSSKKKADLQVKLIDRYALDAQRDHDRYLQTNSKSALNSSQRNYKRAINSLENTIQNTKKVVELQHKYKFEKSETFKAWQTKHYKKYEEALVNTLEAYQAQFRLHQKSKGILSSDLQYKNENTTTAFKSEHGEQFKILLTRALKGLNDPESSKDVNTIVDRALSPKLDHPIDLISGYLTETAARAVLEQYFDGTPLQQNLIIKRVPSAIGNTVSYTSIGNPSYAYTTQIRLLVLQLDLLIHLDEMYVDITQVFNDYSDYVKEQKKNKPTSGKPTTPKKPCTSFSFDDPDHFLTCEK